jgi:fluoroacetyl-CoA thioesterase
MKPTLKAGLKHSFSYTVPAGKTVPKVFATGFMVGLMEWTYVQLLGPHLDPGEGSLGVHVEVSHKAATPVGFAVTVEAECIEVRGPRAKFAVRAHDGVDEIGSGTHERFIMAWDRFNKSVAAKAAKANAKVDA